MVTQAKGWNDCDYLFDQDWSKMNMHKKIMWLMVLVSVATVIFSMYFLWEVVNLIRMYLEQL